MNSIEPTLDHLVYAVPDLESAADEFRARTGLEPAAGGRHLGRGTRNLLVGLGPRSYLEIIGPDPENPVVPGAAMPFGLDQLTEPRLLTWAIRPPDIRSAARAAASAGAELGPPIAMSRRTPTGELLEWTLASTVPLPFGGVTPFLIDWAESRHPAADPDLPLATLLAFTGTHPDLERVQNVLASLEVTLPLQVGPPALQAVLRTPRGLITLA
jgi:hypothetical protein